MLDVHEVLNRRTGLPPRPEEMQSAAQAAGIPGVSSPAGRMHTIHIAGTNGKGSTAAMLESVLRQAGYKTGLFTSPHLVRFTERIRINGQEIPEAALAGLLEEALEAEKKADAQLNYFALVTLMALIYFTEQGCEYCILEAGLGGRLDPTNCMDAPTLCILTRIGLDHMELLGGSLREIIREKAGIIKAGCDVVLAQQDPEVIEQVRQTAGEKGARLHLAAGAPAQWAGQPLELGLRGEYQRENAATVLRATQVLRQQGVHIPDEAVRAGLRGASWPGRYQWVQLHMLVDGAHNPQGALALRRSIEQERPGAACIFIMGFMEDKAYTGILEILAPLARAMIAVPAAQTARALGADTLQRAMRQYCRETYAADTLAQAQRLAEELRTGEELIVVCGSLYLVGAAPP